MSLSFTLSPTLTLTKTPILSLSLSLTPFSTALLTHMSMMCSCNAGKCNIAVVRSSWTSEAYPPCGVLANLLTGAQPVLAAAGSGCPSGLPCTP